MVKFTKKVKELFGNFSYAWLERKEPYINTEIIEKHYNEHVGCLKNIESVPDNHFKYHTHMANLWDRKARLAKDINDSRDEIKEKLTGMITAYGTSAGSVGGAAIIAPSIYANNSEFLSRIAFFGFVLLSGITFYNGIQTQRRLNRIVKEHKNDVRRYKKTEDNIERLKNKQVR